MFFFDRFGGIENYLIRILVLIFSISVHEWAHAYSAYRYGDNTAAMAGRMTLNPTKHFDPFGFLLIALGAPIAWAKPVPVNTRNFKAGTNYKRATLVVALSGILCNLLLAFIGAFLFHFLAFIGINLNLGKLGMTILVVLQKIGSMLLQFNVYLAVFNMLPLPQLDGFELWSRFMPRQFVLWAYENSRAISMVMLLVIVFFSSGFFFILTSIAEPILFVLQWPWMQLFSFLR